ncbi:hypothetical protein EN766_23445 [Mesorhizobium sp. M2A.F.Ca.ET.046.02.1.1]|nr:hypothetical protein EN766_23445 [Mesorhizobium sp. M2A.F.Ca.ET.046.02.1.1]
MIARLVARVWNYAHVPHRQGVAHGDYLQQITYLPFQKTNHERDAFIGEPRIVPGYYWGSEQEGPSTFS